MFVYSKTVSQYCPGIPGCYGPKLYVPYKASADVHKVLSAMSIWNDSVQRDEDDLEYDIYEFTQETFDSPLFKQILRRYNICWEV